jgi:hypothetical protein
VVTVPLTDDDARAGFDRWVIDGRLRWRHSARNGVASTVGAVLGDDASQASIGVQPAIWSISE